MGAPSPRGPVPGPMTYRAAIIGCGRIASLLEQDPLRSKPHTHAGWYRAHPAVSLAAGADQDPERLERFGADWAIGPAHLYRDYREMLRAERPDIVSVAAYAPQRVEMCLAAIEAGARGLWVEKAVACSLAEADRLAEAATAKGVAVIVDHPRRTDSRYRGVRRVIAERTLGVLESVHVLFSGGVLHTGTHAWDLLDFWCGPWASVQAWLDGEVPSAHVGPGPAPDLGAAGGWAPTGRQVLPEGARQDRGGQVHVIFEDGVAAYVSGSAKDYFIFQFDLVFSRGRIQLGNDVCRVFQPATSPRYSGFVELAESGTVDLNDPCEHPVLDDLVHALVTAGQPVMSLRNAIGALELGIAAIQSGEEGRRLERSDVRRDFWVASV